MRARFYEKVRLPATSGNAYHYQQWALEVSGVGAAKVFPLDNGPGTVGILVVDNDMSVSEGLPGKGGGIYRNGPAHWSHNNCFESDKPEY